MDKFKTEIKTENWLGHEIRFVEHNGEWWAVGIDISKALEYSNPSKAIIRHCKGVSKMVIPSDGGNQETNIISEVDIYNLIFAAANQSKNKDIKIKADDFKQWVYNMLKELRTASGLEGFQIFRMLDKEYQREAMDKLKTSLRQPVKVDYIKANTIADKAVSNIYGYSKMVKKGAMTPDMLVMRQGVLQDVVELMVTKYRYGLDISVSNLVYGIYRQ